jgi:hypothetical protein
MNFITDNEIIPTKTTAIVKRLHSLTMSPNAKPAAGGCSVSVITITNIANPTDIAPNTTCGDSFINDVHVINDHKDK